MKYLETKTKKFIDICKERELIEDYMTLLINENMLLWVQWYNGEHCCIELQFREDTNEDFGEYCININDIYEQGELDKFVNEEEKEIEKVGIKNYIYYNKKLLL